MSTLLIATIVSSCVGASLGAFVMAVLAGGARK